MKHVDKINICVSAANGTSPICLLLNLSLGPSLFVSVPGLEDVNIQMFCVSAHQHSSFPGNVNINKATSNYLQQL